MNNPDIKDKSKLLEAKRKIENVRERGEREGRDGERDQIFTES